MKINREFLDKYNISGPRYTSYPPANFFHDQFNTDDYVKEIQASNTQTPENISLYIHIPFCPVRCHFCGCNNIIEQDKVVVRKYIDALKVEIGNVASQLDLSRKLTQIHWGGGTPNSIAMSFIEEVMELIKETFILDKKAEVAIECSPAYLDYKYIDSLSQMGFNRMSLGIQDFREDVLEVLNRRAPKHPVKEIVEYLRKKGFSGINLDFIYGLPLQTVESFEQTLKTAIEIKPDRIVTFSYAHVPWVKEEQKKLEKIGLPEASEKMFMLINSIEQLQNAGYCSIGIDHFARKDDELARAFNNKKLHRNFQGYCTLETTGQVYGFGTSSISQMWGSYSQNHKDITKYINSIENNGYATERGYKLNGDEQIVRFAINSIMCNGILDFNETASKFGLTVNDIKNKLDFNPSKILEFQEDNLVSFKDDKINLNERGRMVARNIAMAFDPALKQGESIYSKTV